MLNHIRVGLGMDVHPLIPGGPLCLGCCEIPFDYHLKGHSDGDVVAHAIADALLSAGGISDLGTFLPASDDSIKGISGEDVLKRVASVLAQAGVMIINVDCTVMCDRPSLAGYVPSMIKATSLALEISPSQVSIKPRHAEGLGFAGTGQGIFSQAVVLVQIDPKIPA